MHLNKISNADFLLKALFNEKFNPNELSKLANT